jgi:CMP-N-acetylneuraminic acid synthetase
MINPVCPLISKNTIREAIEAYKNSECDTLISCDRTQMQVFCEGKGVNIDESKPLAPTQENPFVDILNWAVTIWDTETFLTTYRKNKSGYLGTKRKLFPINPSMSIKVSHEQDFLMAERLMRVHSDESEILENTEPQYWKFEK